MRKLTPKQKRFIEEYLRDLNATAACIRAGYSPRNADKIGPSLLGKSRVQKAISEAQEKRSKRTEITQDRVLVELSALAFSNIQNYVIDDDGNIELAPGAPADAMQAVSSIKRRITYDKDGEKTVTTELRLWNKPGALKLAGRHLGLKGFSDRLELTGKDGGPIYAGITQEGLDAIEKAIMGDPLPPLPIPDSTNPMGRLEETTGPADSRVLEPPTKDEPATVADKEEPKTEDDFEIVP